MCVCGCAATYRNAADPKTYSRPYSRLLRLTTHQVASSPSSLASLSMKYSGGGGGDGEAGSAGHPVADFTPADDYADLIRSLVGSAGCPGSKLGVMEKQPF